jgi:hypothetical protein
VILMETYDDDLLSADEIDRALEVAQNTGGWSFEEAQLIARAFVQTCGKSIVRVRAERSPASGSDG